MNDETLITKLNQLENRIETLEAENQRLREENADLRDHVTTEVEG